MKKIALYVLCISFIHVINAQEYKSINKKKQDFPIIITCGNHIHSMPFKRIFRADPFNFSFSISSEYSYKEKNWGELFQTVDFLYFSHEYLFNGYNFSSTFGYRYKPTFGLIINLNFGIGAVHLFHSTAIYEADNDGNYKQVLDWGKVRPTANYNIDIGYDFFPQINLPFAVFLRYKQFFYILNKTPFINTNIHIGVKFNIKDVLKEVR